MKRITSAGMPAPARHAPDSLNLGAVSCPACRQPMPALRIPTGVHQMMWGGFTCPSCQIRLDKWGEPVRPATTD